VLPVELIDAEGGGEGEGAKSYDGEKAWSSIIHSHSLGSLHLGVGGEAYSDSWKMAGINTYEKENNLIMDK